MESTRIAVDTAKLVFEVAEADGAGKVRRCLRLNRPQFSEYLATREKASFVLEACGGAHHWARLMLQFGHSVRLLPVPYVRAYRRRNKTDRASKRSDRYVRMLLTHGARAVLLRAGQMQRAGQHLNALQRWVLALKERTNHNKATCALANKLARIAWATWRHGTVFDPNQAAAAA